MSEPTPAISTSAPVASKAKPATAVPRPKRRRLLRRAAIVGLLAGTVAAVAVWFFVLREPEPKNDFERFQGEWKLSAPGRPDITFIRVTGDRWQYISNGQEARAYRMTLNEAASPKQIDLELIDTKGLRGMQPKLHGVYAFDGNKTVRIRLDPAVEPRPTTLGDDLTQELTRVKLERNPGPEK